MRLGAQVIGNDNSAAVSHEIDDDHSALAHALKDEAGAAQGLSWTYTYKNAHRLASQDVSVPARRYAPSSNLTTNYAAPPLPGEAANLVDQYEQVSETVSGGSPATSTLTYDVRGNLISDTVTTYSYDFENRMLSATSATLAATYDYDPMGRRVGKSVNGVITRFLHAGDAEIAEYDNGGASP
jgi:hypothetical protein